MAPRQSTRNNKGTNPKRHDQLGDPENSPVPTSRKPSGKAKKARARVLRVHAMLDSGDGPRVKTNEGRVEMTGLTIDRNDPPDFETFQADFELELEELQAIEDPRHTDGAHRHRLAVPLKAKDGKQFNLMNFANDATFGMVIADHPEYETTITIVLGYVEKSKARAAAKRPMKATPELQPPSKKASAVLKPSAPPRLTRARARPRPPALPA